MSDRIGRRLEAIRAAASEPRYRLLRYAVEIGDFPGTRAAEISGASPGTGTGRSTHADGLCAAGLLERVPGRPVRYRATSSGRDTFGQLKLALTGVPVEDPGFLMQGATVLLKLPLGRGRRTSEVRLRVERER